MPPTQPKEKPQITQIDADRATHPPRQRKGAKAQSPSTHTGPEARLATLNPVSVPVSVSVPEFALKVG
jgi:hypothetical protein